MLNFFFDGVPENDSLQAELAAVEEFPADTMKAREALLVRQEKSRFVHYPYEEGECASCHNKQSLGSMVEPQPGLCYLCHEDLSELFTHLHGPVAGGYCTSCHNPHESGSGKLLRIAGDELCYFCHLEPSVKKNEMHQDLDGMFCMDCHHPHGGEDKYIFQ
jgi:predicted CXXCH cytochrome family protein